MISPIFPVSFKAKENPGSHESGSCETYHLDLSAPSLRFFLALYKKTSLDLISDSTVELSESLGKLLRAFKAVQ